MSAVVSTALTLLGGICGWFANDYFSRARDRDKQRSNFIADTEEWRSNVHRVSEVERLANDFDLRFDRFIGHARVIRNGMWKRNTARFDKLCNDVRIAGAHITETDNSGNQTGRAELRDALESTIQFFNGETMMNRKQHVVLLLVISALVVTWIFPYSIYRHRESFHTVSPGYSFLFTQSESLRIDLERLLVTDLAISTIGASFVLVLRSKK